MSQGVLKLLDQIFPVLMCLGIDTVVYSSGVSSTRGLGELWEGRVNPLLPSESGFERDFRADPSITVPVVEDGGVEEDSKGLSGEDSSLTNVAALEPGGGN